MYAILDIVTGDFWRPNGDNAIFPSEDLGERVAKLSQMGSMKSRYVIFELSPVAREHLRFLDEI